MEISPVFVPDSGVPDRLSVPGDTVKMDEEEWEVDNSLCGFSNMDFHPTIGDTYTLTTPAGLSYQIDASTGQLESLSNRNKTELKFGPDGITSWSGGVELPPTVSIRRDSTGRITQIIDPDNHSLSYTYDPDGNLSTVTDRMQRTTTFSYSTDVADYLTLVQDPLGQSAVAPHYYPDGRLQEMTDAAGKTILYSYDTGNYQESTNASGQVIQSDNDTGTISEKVTDQLGNTTEMDLDAAGNVTRRSAPTR